MAAGTYFVKVSSDGLSPNATATNYGFNIGSYSISGSIENFVIGEPPPPPEVLKPLAPSNLNVVKQTGGVLLSWQDNSTNELGFYIERSDGRGIWTRIAVVDSNVTNYFDAITSGQPKYRIVAFNNDGESTPSNQVNIKLNSGKPARGKSHDFDDYVIEINTNIV